MVEPGFSAYPIDDRQDKERLIQALFVSLVLHILFLSVKFPPSNFQRLAGDSSLVVTFTNMNAVLPSPPADGGKRPADKGREMLIQEQPSSFAVKSKPASQASSVPQQIIHGDTVKASKAESVPSAESRYVHKPGEARAVIEVRPDGRIGQIIWDVLPAMTDEQLTQLETAIRVRGHKYPSGDGFVKETIDVRDYLTSQP